MMNKETQVTASEGIKVLVTGGGTGGHIFPALAIADAIREIRPDATFLFVGAEGKMEMDRVPKAGYPIVGLPVAGFQRGFSWSSLRKNASFPVKLLRSSRRATKIISDFQPNVVIGTGGYASGPVMRAAQKAGIPTLIQEQNSLPGLTNRMLAAKAALICVAYQGLEQWFPKEKLLITGNPVRQDLLDMAEKRTEALSHFALDTSRKTIYLTGGSLGAKALNDAVNASLELLSQPNAPNLIWQCGSYYYELMNQSPVAALPNVHLYSFIDRTDLAYAAADVVVSRAGALTISELCIVGAPTILVPSPHVAEDHQTKNALSLVQLGAARLVRDAETVDKLLPEAYLLLENEALSFSLSENIRPLGKPKAARTIAEEALKIAK